MHHAQTQHLRAGNGDDETQTGISGEHNPRNLRQTVTGAVTKIKLMSALANSSHQQTFRDELTLGQLPPECERIKCEDVLKLCQGEWQTRTLLLTKDDLIIAYPGSRQISDKIPLVRRLLPSPHRPPAHPEPPARLFPRDSAARRPRFIVDAAGPAPGPRPPGLPTPAPRPPPRPPACAP
jgi:hypothetical protein